MSTLKKLRKEWLSLQPLKPELQRQMDQSFMIDFNYNSNHLEGNTLTYGQTKLLLLFGDTMGNASMQDYEEMKAHNVGLEMMKVAALDKERSLSEMFIRELNKIILVRDFYKTSSEHRYKIKVGMYKTRPNSVITPTGELFDYASPEETPALMYDLILWYNEEEQKGILTPLELSALFHYRYIRIHPFEDGNGRIARLLMNYILLRHGYPMIVVQTVDRKNYLQALHQCDLLTGTIPFDGANATLKQAKPLTDYIMAITEKKLIDVIQFAKGLISEIVDTELSEADRIDLATGGQKGGQNRWSEILELIKENPSIARKELSEKLNINPSAIQKHIQKMKEANIIRRVGADRGGYWEIVK